MRRSKLNLETAINNLENTDSNDAENKRRKKERSNLLFALLSLLVCLTMPLAAIFGAQESFGKLNDFPEYYGAAKMICSGQGADIYKLDALFKVEHEHFPLMEGRGVGYYIPPFATPLLAWLGTMSAQTSYIAFMSASVIALVFGVLLCAKHFKLSSAGTAWLATALCAGSPVFESMKIAQLAPFLFFSLSLFLYLCGKNRDILAGASLSLMLLKPQELMPLGVYLLFARRWKNLAGLLGIAILCGFASVLMLQLQGYFNYFDLLKDSASNTQFMQPELGATVRGQLLRLIPASPANMLSAVILLVTSAGIAAAALKCGRTARFEKGLLQLALPLGLVSALHCHDYDLLLLTPWALSILLPEQQSDSTQTTQSSLASQIPRYALYAFLLVLAIPIYVPIHYNWLLRDRQALNPIFLLFMTAAIASTVHFCTPRRKP